MTKKITAILLTLCMAISILPMSVQAASKPDIKVGDYVKMGAYNNASILWRCVSIDDNGPLMLADKIVDTLAYDAKTNDNSNSKSHSRSYKRDDYGSNYWKDSNMRSWLNSTAAEGKVDWLCGNPPKDGYVSGVGAYNEKAGFLNAFSKSEIAAMKTVTQRSLVSHPEYNKGIVDGDANSDLLYYTDISEAVANYDSSYFETTTEKVFLLDVKQANAVWKNLKGYYVAYNNDGMASHSCYRLQSRYALYQFIGSGRSLCSVVFRFGRKTCILSRFRIFCYNFRQRLTKQSLYRLCSK